ncbi:hypothetical protein AB6A40_004304 [Gnathostoma spinigerum]|uniref:Phosphomannomutase n=1 Tax=Gnathostoma spinigerum TaxID=75299 RepID=A0ABD6EMT3_9BILA
MSRGPILLFDVDGTLTLPRQAIDDTMLQFLDEVRSSIPVAIVGGSDIDKIVEQLGGDFQKVISRYDYVFAENGLVGYHGQKAYPVQSIKQHIGEDRLKKIINFTLRKFSEMDIPVKRGNFIEFRSGMLNLCPVGRSCSQEERIQFFEYDKIHKVRQKFVDELKAFTNNWNIEVCIGGQISVDVFPTGWSKSFCLQYLSDYNPIYFFGDKTSPGGNDYEVFIDSRTVGHSVTNPKDTKEQVEALLAKLKS